MVGSRLILVQSRVQSLVPKPKVASQGVVSIHLVARGHLVQVEVLPHQRHLRQLLRLPHARRHQTLHLPQLLALHLLLLFVLQNFVRFFR